MSHSIKESDSDSPNPLFGLRWNDTRDPVSLYNVIHDKKNYSDTIMTRKLLSHDYGKAVAQLW